MKKMTRQEMIEFLRGMNLKQKWLEEEKRRLKDSIETMEEAIERQRKGLSEWDPDLGKKNASPPGTSDE